MLCAVVIAAALGFIGFCVYNGFFNLSILNKKISKINTER